MSESSEFVLPPGSRAMVEVELPSVDAINVAARHILFELDGDHALGIQPSGFITLLIGALIHADPQNLSKISLGFPALATAVDLYKNKSGGVELLRRLASQTLDTQPGDEVSPKGN